jgi:quercetin dioxygenase-like cupin family protein
MGKRITLAFGRDRLDHYRSAATARRENGLELWNKGGKMDRRQDAARPHPGTTTGSDERPAQQLAGTVLRFDLTAELEQLQAESEWSRGDRNAITLVKEGDVRITLAVLSAGARMDPHRTDGYTSIQVMAGRLRVVSTDTLDLGPGELLVIGKAVVHEVVAVEDAAFLLTIALPAASAAAA